MNIKLIVIFGLVCLLALTSARPAEDYEYEEEPAPPPKKAPARSSLLNRRNPLSGRNTKTTSTTTLAPVETEEEGEPVEGEDDTEPESVSSTTEAPKKFIKSGVVRPFRSNDDLLASLKRRREQAASNKVSKISQTEAEESAPAPVEEKPSASKVRPTTAARRNRFSKNNEAAAAAPAAPAEESSTAAPARSGRRFSSRS